MENIAIKVLDFLNNNHTKVVVKEEFEGNYYSFLMDAIFLSGKINRKIPKGAPEISNKTAEFITICHECVHSIQNKLLHILNIAFSNMSIFSVVASLILRIVNRPNKLFFLITALIIALSLFVRIYLENNAIEGSINVAKQLVKNNAINDISMDEIEVSRDYIKKNKLIGILGMIKDKIAMLIIVCAILFI